MTDAVRFYETQALNYLDTRDRSGVGVEIVRNWAKSLPPGSTIVDIACGGGYPITRVLVDSGLVVWVIDTSPTLLKQLRLRFPMIPTQCASALGSDYFGRTFDAVISIGFLFLLGENEQLVFLRRVSEILRPHGRFLFTAPIEMGTWQDVTTGLECCALGRATYTRALEREGFRLIRTHIDEGENNYYEAEKIG